MTCRSRMDQVAARQLASPLGRVQGGEDPRVTRIMRDVWRDWGGFYVTTADPDLTPEQRAAVQCIGERRFGKREGAG